MRLLLKINKTEQMSRFCSRRSLKHRSTVIQGHLADFGLIQAGVKGNAGGQKLIYLIPASILKRVMTASISTVVVAVTKLFRYTEMFNSPKHLCSKILALYLRAICLVMQHEIGVHFVHRGI